ncbi:unnamed protein product [Closterium sp. Yama58-4]|nr:unnamed protein product [Closterium sp. Yama58-4]
MSWSCVIGLKTSGIDNLGGKVQDQLGLRAAAPLTSPNSVKYYRHLHRTSDIYDMDPGEPEVVSTVPLYNFDGKIICNLAADTWPLDISDETWVLLPKLTPRVELPSLPSLPHFRVYAERSSSSVDVNNWEQLVHVLRTHGRVGLITSARGQYQFGLLPIATPSTTTSTTTSTSPPPPPPAFAHHSAPPPTGFSSARAYYAPLPAGIPRRAPRFPAVLPGLLAQLQMRPAAHTAPAQTSSDLTQNAPRFPAVLPGLLPQQQMRPAHTAPGQMAPGQMAPGQMAPGQMAPGQMAPGQMAPGQMAPGQMAPGQAVVHSHVAPGQARAQVANVPVLRVCDDGKGMDHGELVQMLSLGHDIPAEEDPHHIGRFGVGFKTGTMRIGNDALVLTQSTDSRSIALLSRSLNQGRQELEIPIVTYRRVVSGGVGSAAGGGGSAAGGGGSVEWQLDVGVHSEEEAERRKRAIFDFSPLDERKINQEFRKLEQASGSSDTPPTGTRIYVFNLKRLSRPDAAYELEWDDDAHDILIRTRRPRSRPNQLCQDVPIDYSLRAYLRVMFLHNPATITVQGRAVQGSVDIAENLSQPFSTTGTVMGQPVQVRMGMDESERACGRCGFFLYWHGRLIEAYKRVGRMEYSGDAGLGVVGVVDTTALFDAAGELGVLNCKQRFAEGEEYQRLKDFLSVTFNQYWEDNFDRDLPTTNIPEGAVLQDHRDWVQCDKCEQWHILPPHVTKESLPENWFCYMEPIRGTCNDPNYVEPAPNEVTLGISRHYSNYPGAAAAAASAAGAAGAATLNAGGRTVTGTASDADSNCVPAVPRSVFPCCCSQGQRNDERGEAS